MELAADLMLLTTTSLAAGARPRPMGRAAIPLPTCIPGRFLGALPSPLPRTLRETGELVAFLPIPRDRPPPTSPPLSPPALACLVPTKEAHIPQLFSRL